MGNWYLGGGRGLDEALNKSSQQPVTMTWRGPVHMEQMVACLLALPATNYSICIKDNFVRWEAKLPAAGNLKSGTISLEDGTNIWTRNDHTVQILTLKNASIRNYRVHTPSIKKKLCVQWLEEYK